MASLNDKLNKLKDQLAKEKESREAAEARAEAKAEARADEQRKQHEALLKILSQLQSPSGHEEAKNQDTPVQEAPVAGGNGEMSPSNWRLLHRCILEPFNDWGGGGGNVTNLSPFWEGTA